MASEVICETDYSAPIRAALEEYLATRVFGSKVSDESGIDSRKRLLMDPRLPFYRGGNNRRIIDEVLKRYPNFLTDPASTKYHGSWEGGLFDHSIAVYLNALKLAPAFGNIAINPFACLLHDLCKCGQYVKEQGNSDKRGLFYKYNPDAPLDIGHGAESLKRMNECEAYVPDPWEYAVVYHMGAFTDSQQERLNFGKACEKYKEVLLLHTADMMASKIHKM